MQGNVALDVARILLRCTSELAATDIADYALDALRGSTIKCVQSFEFETTCSIFSIPSISSVLMDDNICIAFFLYVKEGILGWEKGPSTGSMHS